MKSTLALTPSIQPQHRLKPAMLESLNILHMSSDALAEQSPAGMERSADCPER